MPGNHILIKVGVNVSRVDFNLYPLRCRVFLGQWFSLPDGSMSDEYSSASYMAGVISMGTIQVVIVQARYENTLPRVPRMEVSETAVHFIRFGQVSPHMNSAIVITPIKIKKSI